MEAVAGYYPLPYLVAPPAFIESQHFYRQVGPRQVVPPRKARSGFQLHFCYGGIKVMGGTTCSIGPKNDRAFTACPHIRSRKRLFRAGNGKPSLRVFGHNNTVDVLKGAARQADQPKQCGDYLHEGEGVLVFLHFWFSSVAGGWAGAGWRHESMRPS